MMMIREREEGELDFFKRQKSQQKSVEQNVYLLILRSIFEAQALENFGLIFCHIQSHLTLH